MLKGSAKRVLVLGAGAEAQALATAIARMPQVQSVRQQATYETGTRLPDAHLCIEMLDGLSVAYNASIQALAQGMGLVVGSAMLAATHGKLLAAAAQGQGAYFACAAHGLGLMPGMLQALQANSAVWLPQGVPAQLLARLYARQETFDVARQQLALRGLDMSELSGKRIQVQAHALLGAWQGQWLNPSQQRRVGLDYLDQEALPLLRGLGLRMAYGAQLQAKHIYTGPLAVTESQAELAMQETRLMAMTAQGACAFSALAPEAAQAALLGAVQAYAAGQRQNVLAPGLPVAETQPLVAVLATLATREACVAQGALVNQFLAGERWAGVMAAEPIADWPEGTCVVPLPMGYTRPVTARLQVVERTEDANPWAQRRQRTG